MTMNPLLQLMTCGQSYWLDNLTRDMITDGELHRRVTEQGLRGVTSNPATFHKAIVGSSAYDTNQAAGGGGGERPRPSMNTSWSRTCKTPVTSCDRCTTPLLGSMAL